MEMWDRTGICLECQGCSAHQDVKAVELKPCLRVLNMVSVKGILFI